MRLADFAADEWKLEVQKADASSLFISLDEIRKLPKTEIVFEFKCIEAGARLAIGVV